MFRCWIFLCSAFAVLIFVGSAAGSTLPSDDNAYQDVGGTDPLIDGNGYWRGSVNFSAGFMPPFNLDADVEYAVYAPTKFEDSFGSVGSDDEIGWGDWDEIGDNDWVYAYQIFNNIATEIDVFTVGLDSEALPIFIDYLEGYGVHPPDGPDPVSQPELRGWRFAPSPPATPAAAVGNGLALTGDSTIMFFTAPGGPISKNATLQGGTNLSLFLPSPMPTPEPATLHLLLVAVAIVALRRRVR